MFYLLCVFYGYLLPNMHILIDDSARDAGIVANAGVGYFFQPVCPNIRFCFVIISAHDDGVLNQGVFPENASDADYRIMDFRVIDPATVCDNGLCNLAIIDD